MRQAAATTSAPSARAWQSTHSRIDRPVVTMSSTTITFSPGRDLEAAAELELAVDALGVDGGHAQMARGLVAGDDAADGGRDDLADVAIALGADLLRPARGRAFSALSGCMKTRAFCRNTGERRPEREDEMAFQQRPHWRKNVEHFVLWSCAALSRRSGLRSTRPKRRLSASATVARRTWLSPGVSLREERTSVI